ncbi:MAG: DUF1998 domain-containing protein [Gammaproteobacteria bacterium]|nr:DUF1998 domain-containing protein [Gammaproteobacteria bacterium]
METIQQSIEQLHGALRDYIEATYHISAESLIHRRKALLDIPGVIHQIPYLESTPRYETGESFSKMPGLAPAALEAFNTLSQPQGDLPKLIYDPPYLHQSEAVRGSLIDRRNLVIMTGTGSGKTESFLLPILGKLACEASRRPDAFAGQPAMRALVLYPMNALVNDQLGRLRGLFGDPRLVSLFNTWAGRPPRFGRYTSRTPYAGVRTSRKDSAKFRAFDEFYVDIERLAHDPMADGHDEARRLRRALKERGKWPAKPDLRAWLGEKGARWRDPKTGAFVRGVTLPDDSELLTRHEIQSAPPDLLITNYSMLEYMMMRPIERSIFDTTRTFIEHNPDEDFLVVLDEAHLYRGAAGAEVSLLLRRLRDRLDVPAHRFRIICATASFNDHAYAPEFGAQLSGLPASTFLPISGSLDLRAHDGPGSIQDADVFAGIDLERYYSAPTVSDRHSVIEPIVKHRQSTDDPDPERALYHALADFPPMGRLLNMTMKQAIAVAELGQHLFPDTGAQIAEKAVNALMALGSAARLAPKTPGLLPCRVHNFFRGLPGLWACMDPACANLDESESDGICGTLFSQPRESCQCGARVLEFFTCRNCGTAYARAYTDDIDCPSALWPEPGESLRMAEGETGSLAPLDLLLETPASDEVAEPADYDLETGRLNPPTLGTRMRRVYLRGDRLADSTDEEDDKGDPLPVFPGQFAPCAVCGKKTRWGTSYVQDHQTKGDQPFQALVSRQLQIQPPSHAEPTPFAPLQGRKVLTFSDSRQVAARLAPNLQMYSVRDSLRPLIAWGFQRLQAVPLLQPNLNLNDLYLAVLLAAHTLHVRLRPEMKAGESFGADITVRNAFDNKQTNNNDGLVGLCMQIRSERPPEALLEQIVTTVQDRFLGFEPLALASLAERGDLTARLHELPSIPGVAETPEAKVELVRAWLRCWQSYGFWLGAMPPVWGQRPRSQGISVRAKKGKFKAMQTVLADRAARKIFDSQWPPKLLDRFTEATSNGFRRLRGNELSLAFEGRWMRCPSCKSVHRPVSTISHCLDCGSGDIGELDPDRDAVFLARKGFYRNPVTNALVDPPKPPLALIAAEHTAQLNAPQNEDVFSKAEENELLFQDIALGERANSSTAVDVLSSTTTMEVGIDIGALSGVALRNMPPGRANYQQRSGRAGRRGNAVATVVAFGSADSHDEHYFTNPDGMIRGNVVDPKLTLDNPDIVRRHIRAFLLQSYHQDRIPGLDSDQKHDLFSVLGTVAEFRDPSSVLNRKDFATWLVQQEDKLRGRVSSWIPQELGPHDRHLLLSEFAHDCLDAIDDAIGSAPSETGPSDEADEVNEAIKGEYQPEEDDENPQQQAANTDKLLDRLLYCGKLPRYAFPTDAATFHVFDTDRSTRLRPIMRFAPQQGLSVALSQYAPGKQVWISGKCYTSSAIYSVDPNDRFAAWDSKRIYMECDICGFANTYAVGEAQRHETRDCPACGGAQTFGPGRYWLRPPGFAHPIDTEEVTSPDDIPETSYATRAKLTMDTPDETDAWTVINERLRVLPSRKHLLVSNTGPKKDGYTYCTQCGRIETTAAHPHELHGTHLKPYPDDEDKRNCDGINPTRHLVLGTDFIADIALFSLRVEPPMSLKPGHTSTLVALRTVSEALAAAACQLLELEPGELMAEFRPALTPAGTTGLEAEVFLYDTLPGGAGFSTQLPQSRVALFRAALDLLTNCEERCDASCYRCLRSFKNKLEHRLLDRHVGAQLLRYLIDGQLADFSPNRLASSTALLRNDLERQCVDGTQFELDAPLLMDGSPVTAPILATTADGRRLIIALSAPLTPLHPADASTANLGSAEGIRVIVENELIVRGNLPAATQRIVAELR